MSNLAHTTNGGEHGAGLLDLPSDVLILVFQYLSVKDLVHISMSCHAMNTMVNEFGWSVWLRENPRSSFSLSATYDLWSPYERIRYHALSDSGWESSRFIARPLSRPWLGKFRPALALSPTRLLIGAGNKLHSYLFTAPTSTAASPRTYTHAHGAVSAPCVVHECVYEVDCSLPDQKADITSVVFVPEDPSTGSKDGSSDRTVCVSFSNGVIYRVYLPPPTHSQPAVAVHVLETLDYNVGECIEHLSSRGSLLLSLSSSGTAALMNPSNLSPFPNTIDLREKSWTSYIPTHSHTFAAFGISSATPLRIHSLTSPGLSAEPFALLAPSPGSRAGRSVRLSAVYGISGAPAGFPGGASDQIVVSGWYDGFVRVHDLRDHTRASSSYLTNGTRTSNGSPSPAHIITSHLPVLSLNDPWSLEPIYAIACGGGSAAHIAAGSARHSVVSLWDVRAHKRAIGQGWSVHAPGNDASPVYGVAMESARVYGVTQSRGFVYDFGPGVGEGTYPPIVHPPGVHGGGGGRGVSRSDGLGKREGYGYYVTKYHFNKKIPF